jgi:hypothetical protein
MNIAMEDIKFLEGKAKNEIEVKLISQLAEEGKTFTDIEFFLTNTHILIDYFPRN